MVDCDGIKTLYSQFHFINYANLHQLRNMGNIIINKNTLNSYIVTNVVDKMASADWREFIERHPNRDPRIQNLQ